MSILRIASSCMIRVTVLDTLSAYGSFHEVSTKEKWPWGRRFVHLVAGAMRVFKKAGEDATAIVDVGDIESEDQPGCQSIPESYQHKAARQKTHVCDSRAASVGAPHAAF
jgi:hypothetical protein